MPGSTNAGRAVLDDDTFGGLSRKRRCGAEKNRRIRLPRSDLISTEDPIV